MKDLKIVGDLRENSKLTVTGTVTGGTEASSRVQWFKSSCSILEGGNNLEELSTSKVAKVCQCLMLIEQSWKDLIFC